MRLDQQLQKLFTGRLTARPQSGTNPGQDNEACLPTALSFTDATLQRPPLAEIFEHHACFCAFRLVCAVEVATYICQLLIQDAPLRTGYYCVTLQSITDSGLATRYTTDNGRENGRRGLPVSVLSHISHHNLA